MPFVRIEDRIIAFGPCSGFLTVWPLSLVGLGGWQCGEIGDDGSVNSHGQGWRHGLGCSSKGLQFVSQYLAQEVHSCL